MSDTYANLDAARDVEEAIAWQERVDAWPAIAAYKLRMDELSRASTPVIDVGAGPGLDARRVGAVAIDSSRSMARRGRQHGVPYVIADGRRLPLASGAAGCIRADRVLQHLDDPRPAVEEIARCLRPGGRLVVCDPDQQTLSIAVPGAPDRLVAQIRRLRRDVGYRSGTYVTALPGWLLTLGFTDVTVEAFPLVLRDPDDAFGIATWAWHWADGAGFTGDECETWERAVHASRDRGFLYSVSYVVVGATRS